MSRFERIEDFCRTGVIRMGISDVRIRQPVTLACVFCCFLMFGTLASWGQQPESTPESIQQYRAAVALQNQQLYDLAVDEWRAFVKDYGDDPLVGDAYHYLGVCHFQLGDFKAAQPHFQSALKRKSKAKLRASSLLNLGLTQFNLGPKNKAQYEQAIKSFTSLSKEFPNTPESRTSQFYAAESLTALGRNDEALQMYQRGLAGKGDGTQTEKLLYGLAVAHQESDNHSEALKAFERLLREFGRGPYAAEAAVRRGDALLALDRVDDASTVFAKSAANRLSEFADYALLRQAACEYRKKRYAQAGRLYADLIRNHPESKYVDTAVFAVGKSFYLAGDYKTARKWLAKAAGAKGKPALEAAHFLSLVDIKSGRAEQSLAKIKDAIAAAEDDSEFLPQLRMDYADALYEIPARRSEATRMYAKIADSYKDHSVAPQARYMAAFSALAEKQYEAAISQADQFEREFRTDDLLPDVTALKAESLLQAKRVDDSASLWERLVDKFPKHQDVEGWIVRRAICLNQKQQHKQVVRWLESNWEMLKSESPLGEAQYLMGSALWNLKKKDQAVAMLNRSLKTSPDGAQSERALLLLSSVGGTANPQAALAAIDQLMKRKNVTGLVKSEAQLRKAELMFDAGRFAEAASSYQSILASNDLKASHPAALLGLAWSELNREEYRAAMTALGRLEQEFGSDPTNQKGHYLRGVALQQLGEPSKAVTYLQRFLSQEEKAQERANALYVRGLCQTAMEEHQAAVESFNEAIRETPDGKGVSQLRYELAWAYQSAGDEEKSARTFRKLAEENPQGELAAEGYFRNAEYFFSKGKYEKALKGFTKSYKAANNDVKIGERAINKIGWTAFQMSDFNQAKQAFDEQRKRFPAGELTADAAMMTAECDFQQKDYGRALDGFERALPNVPRDSTLKPLGMLHAAQCATKADNWRLASTLLQQMKQDYPESNYLDEAEYELAWSLQNQDKIDEALPLYSAVADRTTRPIGARARFMEGELLFAKKQYPEAIRVFFKVAYGYGYPESPDAYHEWQANSMFEAARCCESTKRISSAKRLYEDLIKHFPENSKAATARKKLAAISRK